MVPGGMNLLALGGRKPINLVISSDTLNYNVHSAALATGWDGVNPADITVTINSGVYVGSSSVGSYSFDTGSSYPASSTLFIVNNGYIYGAGGAGARGTDAGGVTASPGGVGGPALLAQWPSTFSNLGTIAGGGGGGGGGGNNPSANSTEGGGGGGGGQGYSGGSGGSGGAGGNGPGINGSNGSPSAPGSGGPGYNNGDSDSYYGGYGGFLGTSGSPGELLGSPGGSYGGAGGYSVVGNSNISWVVTGTRIGSIG